MALLETRPPVPEESAPVPRRKYRPATKSGTCAASAGKGGDSIDLTTSEESGRAEAGGQGSAAGGGEAGGLGAHREESEEEDELEDLTHNPGPHDDEQERCAGGVPG